AVADWYKEFAPPEKQHRWQLELNSLTQQEHERVDTYTTKFKKLLNRVNPNNCLPDAYIVRMFLGVLKEKGIPMLQLWRNRTLHRDCISEKKISNNKAGNSRRQWKQDKLLNFCEISLEKDEQNREMYNLGNDSVDPKILKCPINPD
ncbi:23860_t:CDS:2, partial [Gigaspora rosea]